MNAPATYETTFIVNASLEDTQIEAAIEKVKDIIVRNGGEIRSTEKWGRKRLAYPVQKKNNGYYCVLEFVAPGDAIMKLDRHFQLDEHVLRFLTVRLDKKALKSKDLAAARKAAAEAQAEEKPAPPTA